MTDSPSSGPARDRRQVFVPAPDPSSPPRRPEADRPAPERPAPRTPSPGPDRPDGDGGGRRWDRRRWLGIGLAALLCLLALVVGGFLWANWKFGQIERVEVSEALGGGSGTNYLIVGSDSREGIQPDDPNAGALIGGEVVAGQRSDTLLILRLDGSGTRMLSIPRDLFVTLAGTGEQGRVNAAYNGGPLQVVETVRDNLGIPIHRYVELDFVSFAGLVDAVGGITIDFPHPAFDDQSGLRVEQSGPVELDGSQALAYVRARHYTEIVDGQPRTDPTGDLGRVERQQRFLRAVLSEVGSTRNPLALMRIGDSLVDGLKIDDDMTIFDAFGLYRRMDGLDPRPETLPTRPFRTSSGAAVLELVESEAEPVLDGFR